MTQSARSSIFLTTPRTNWAFLTLCLLFFDEVLAFDNVRKQIWMVATADVTLTRPDDAYAKAVKRLAAMETRLAKPIPKLPQSRNARPVEVKRRTSKKNFLAAVERTKKLHRRRRHLCQAVLSQRLDVSTGMDTSPGNSSPLRTVNPSPYMYFLRFDGRRAHSGGTAPGTAKSRQKMKQTATIELAGSSPELLVRVHDRKVEYRLIAGTCLME